MRYIKCHDTHIHTYTHWSPLDLIGRTSGCPSLHSSPSLCASSIFLSLYLESSAVLHPEQPLPLSHPTRLHPSRDFPIHFFPRENPTWRTLLNEIVLAQALLTNTMFGHANVYESVGVIWQTSPQRYQCKLTLAENFKQSECDENHTSFKVHGFE